MRPPIVGFQQHNSTCWDRVALSLVSAMQWLATIESLTGRQWPELRAGLVELRQQASRERARAQRTLEELAVENPAKYRRCHEGLEPWPDEDALTFTGRCNCHDQCFHRFADERPEMVESPWFECKCPGVRPPCPVPGHPTEASDAGTG